MILSSELVYFMNLKIRFLVSFLMLLMIRIIYLMAFMNNYMYSITQIVFMCVCVCVFSCNRQEMSYAHAVRSRYVFLSCLAVRLCALTTPTAYSFSPFQVCMLLQKVVLFFYLLVIFPFSFFLLPHNYPASLSPQIFCICSSKLFVNLYIVIILPFFKCWQFISFNISL